MTMTPPKDFAAPPDDCAKYANRMSPAGVSMFYGSDEFETACVETYDAKEHRRRKVATGGQFHCIEPLNVLDLTAIPRAPSYFVEWTCDFRNTIRFLTEFAWDLSQRIEKDGRQHTDYVPTQAFTEYVRFELQTSNKEPIHGIRYPSCWDGTGNYVIFAGHEECLPPTEFPRRRQLLEFVDKSTRTVTVATVRGWQRSRRKRQRRRWRGTVV